MVDSLPVKAKAASPHRRSRQPLCEHVSARCPLSSGRVRCPLTVSRVRRWSLHRAHWSAARRPPLPTDPLCLAARLGRDSQLLRPAVNGACSTQRPSVARPSAAAPRGWCVSSGSPLPPGGQVRPSEGYSATLPGVRSDRLRGTVRLSPGSGQTV